MADLVFSGVVFDEAVAFLRDLLGITDAEWRRILRGSDAAADEATDAAAEAVRRDLLDAVREALQEGKSLEDFRDEYDRITERHGWTGPGDNPGWHAELIFRTQTANAQSAGRWRQIQRLKRFRPFIRYVTARDDRVRLVHREWHGIVLPVDHPFWQTHWPPNGFNCRCFPQSLSQRDLDRSGFTVTPDDDPGLSIPPDKGWSGNVGVAWDRLSGA